MITQYVIIRPDGSLHHRTVDWPMAPGYDTIRVLVEPLLDGADMEHVAVRYCGLRRDLFVDENGHARGLPHNKVASAIYRAAALARCPRMSVEEMPDIVGTAILFPERVVWT